MQKLSLGIIPSSKRSFQGSIDAERGTPGSAVSHYGSAGSRYAAEERSVALGNSGKVVASPFDTPSTVESLTTKGSQNTSNTGDPITGELWTFQARLCSEISFAFIADLPLHYEF